MVQFLTNLLRAGLIMSNARPLAIKAMKRTLSKITYSSNIHKNNGGDQKKLDEMRKKTADFDLPIYSLEWIKAIAKLAMEYGVGNCLEKTCFAIADLVAMQCKRRSASQYLFV
jgi:hypothetical protein